MTEELETGQRLLASGDVSGLLRHLRFHGETLTLSDVGSLVAGAAKGAGYEDLAASAAAVAQRGDDFSVADTQTLYDFDYACIERGIPGLAVRPLTLALQLAPGGMVLSELVSALERDRQHARAVTVLEQHASMMEWPHRFEYVYNALIAGELAKAVEGFDRLPEPDDPVWIQARAMVRDMLARVEVVRHVTSLDRRDLRGWHDGPRQNY